MTSQAATARVRALPLEALALGALLLLHLAVNLATAGWYPAGWVDEAQFADPALNWVVGRGWTSTVWISQTTDAFWAGNAPLFSALLAGWLHLLGRTDMQAVRSLNPLLLALALPIAWDAVRRAGWLPSRGQRLLLALLLLSGHSIVFGMRWVRYDVLAMLLASSALWAWVALAGRWRLAALVAVGALMPATGLQLVPATLVTLAIVLALSKPRPWPPAAALASGLVIGTAGLAGWFAAHGVLLDFMASTKAVGVIGQSVGAKLLAMPRVLAADKTLLLLLAAAAVAALLRGAGGGLRLRPLALPAALTFGIPLVLQLAGKFPVYYAWMVYLPAFVLLSRLAAGLSARAAVLPWLLAALACLPGLPLRLAAAWTAGQATEAAALDSLLWPHLRPGAHVLTDFKAYHAVRNAGAVPYGDTALPMLRPDERAALGWIVARPTEAAAWQRAVGGDWHLCASWNPPEPVADWPQRFVLELREQHHGLQLWQRQDPALKPTGTCDVH